MSARDGSSTGDYGPVSDWATFVDAAVQYAQHIPVNVIARMLGFPIEDDDYRACVHAVIESVNQPVGLSEAQVPALDAYLDRQIEEHRAHPRDDLTSYLLEAEINGNQLSHEHVRGSMIPLLIAGIDTTWSAIGSSLWHLAHHRADVAPLTTEPGLMLFAVEELLSAYAPVPIARLVEDDYDFHGCPMRADDWVLLPFPAANRNPELFEDAEEFVIDRAENRHGAFMLGIHRCLGSNLARLELRVAIEEFVGHFPNFELAGDARWSVGQFRGPCELPVRTLDAT